MKKRQAQATVFIVLAILIVAIILAFVLINQNSTQSNIELAFSKLGIASQTSVPSYHGGLAAVQSASPLS